MNWNVFSFKNKSSLEVRVVDSVPVQMSDAQTSDSTNVRHTYVDQYKCRTSTNIRLVQTSDQCKCRTGTFTRKNVGLGRFWMDHCFNKCQTMNSTRSYSLIHISLQPAVVDLKYFKLLVFLFLVLFSSKDPRKLIISSFSLFTTAPPGQELFFLWMHW